MAKKVADAERPHERQRGVRALLTTVRRGRAAARDFAEWERTGAIGGISRAALEAEASARVRAIPTQQAAMEALDPRTGGGASVPVPHALLERASAAIDSLTRARASLQQLALTAPRGRPVQDRLREVIEVVEAMAARLDGSGSTEPSRHARITRLILGLRAAAKAGGWGLGDVAAWVVESESKRPDGLRATTSAIEAALRNEPRRGRPRRGTEPGTEPHRRDRDVVAELCGAVRSDAAMKKRLQRARAKSSAAGIAPAVERVAIALALSGGQRAGPRDAPAARSKPKRERK